MKKFSALILSIFIIFSIVTGCSSKLQSTTQTSTVKQDTTPVATPVSEKWKAALFFSNKNADKLIKEEREITTDKKLDNAAKAKMSLELLIKGSESKELMTTIPSKTKVNTVIFEKDTAVIDISKEFITDNVGGSAGETMAIAPIVLTLTSFDGIKQVQFKIEGKIQTDFKGHFTLDRAFKKSDFEQYISK